MNDDDREPCHPSHAVLEKAGSLMARRLDMVEERLASTMTELKTEREQHTVQLREERQARRELLLQHQQLKGSAAACKSDYASLQQELRVETDKARQAKRKHLEKETALRKRVDRLQRQLKDAADPVPMSEGEASRLLVEERKELKKTKEAHRKLQSAYEDLRTSLVDVQDNVEAQTSAAMTELELRRLECEELKNELAQLRLQDSSESGDTIAHVVDVAATIVACTEQLCGRPLPAGADTGPAASSRAVLQQVDAQLAACLKHANEWRSASDRQDETNDRVASSALKDAMQALKATHELLSARDDELDTLRRAHSTCHGDMSMVLAAHESEISELKLNHAGQIAAVVRSTQRKQTGKVVDTSPRAASSFAAIIDLERARADGAEQQLAHARTSHGRELAALKRAMGMDGTSAPPAEEARWRREAAELTELLAASEQRAQRLASEAQVRLESAEDAARRAAAREADARRAREEGERRAADAEAQAVVAVRRAGAAEEDAASAGRRAATAEARVVAAERRAGDADARASAAERRAGDAEARAAAGRRAADGTGARVTAAENRAENAEAALARLQARTAAGATVAAEGRANGEERTTAVDQPASSEEQAFVFVERRDKQNIDAMRADMEAVMRAALQQQSQQQSQWSQLCRNLQARNKALKKACDEHKRRCAQLEEEAVAAQEEMAKVDTENDGLKEELVAAAGVMENIAKTVEGDVAAGPIREGEGSGSRHEDAAKVAFSSAMEKAATERAEQLEGELRTLRQRLSSEMWIKEKDAQAWVSDKKSLRNRIQSLEKDKSELTSGCKELKREVFELQKQVDTMNKTLEDSRRKQKRRLSGGEPEVAESGRAGAAAPHATRRNVIIKPAPLQRVPVPGGEREQHEHRSCHTAHSRRRDHVNTGIHDLDLDAFVATAAGSVL